MAFWLDASNIDGANNSSLADGDLISQWNDLSGYGYHATQGNDSLKPAYNAATTSVHFGGNSPLNIEPFAKSFGQGEMYVVVNIPSDEGFLGQHNLQGSFHKWGGGDSAIGPSLPFGDRVYPNFGKHCSKRNFS